MVLSIANEIEPIQLTKAIKKNLLIMGCIGIGKTLAAKNLATLYVHEGKRVVIYDELGKSKGFTSKLNGVNVNLEDADLDLFKGGLVNVSSNWDTINRNDGLHLKTIDLFLSLVRNQKADVLIIDEAQWMLRGNPEYVKLKELLEAAKEYDVAIVIVLQDIDYLFCEDDQINKHFPDVLLFRSTRFPKLLLERGKAVFFDSTTMSNAKVTYNFSADELELYLG